MRLSFDLDDTLICYQQDVPCESCRFPSLLKIWYREPLRAGTRNLVRDLQRMGWDVCIYTTSYRSPILVRLWLAWHGILVSCVINQHTYEARLRQLPPEYSPSKNPRLFGIDLHIDDSEALSKEGERYGFDVVVLSPDDLNWTERVLAAACRRSRR